MKNFIILFVFSFSIIYSQNITIDNNKDFERALNYYNSKKYNDALNLFKIIAERTENNTKNTASAFFVSKILVDQKKYSEAEKSLNSFLSKYPKSKYSDEIKNLLIKTYVDKAEFEKAFESSIVFIESSSSIVFKNETKNIAEKIAINNLRSSEVEKFIDKTTSLKPFILLITGKLYLAEGDNSDAVKMFDEVISKYPTSDEYAEALNLKKNQIDTQADTGYPILGVLLSLTDNNGRVIESAKEILEGIKFAFHEYNTENSEKVGMIVSDVKRDELAIIQETNKFIENSNVRGILGPVFSDDVRYALKELQRSNVILISPTATDDDLRSLSENFYQANPSLTERGKIFAQYLYYVENKRNLAVINSIEGYSPLLASSFSQEFEKLGGKIAAKETYKSKSFSLAEQMTRIALVANSLDGIYAPISDGSDANAILSQMVQSGLNLKIYGNQDWFLAKGFESSPELSNNLTFESDYFIDYNDPVFNEFAEKFTNATGMQINRNILYGYDTAKYLLTVVKNIDPTRKNIKYKIESGINVTGFHNNISFDSERINKFINIVRFNDGLFQLVDKFRADY
jgi:branched-chain amino acid transport system substrate-binding protein